VLLRLGKGHPEDDEPEDDAEYAELVLTAGLSPAPVETCLRRLALGLAGVSAALGALFALVGRRLCRRALEPVVRIAAAARALARSDPSAAAAIPSPGTGDEPEGLARAFNELLDRRHEALERQRWSAGDASHQLRTPLAGLLSLVEVTRRRPRPAGEYEAALDRVRREANRLGEIVESLLALARSRSEAAPPGGEPLDLAARVPEQLRRWAGNARRRPAARGGGGSAWVAARPPLLAQALENLVNNALKYSEPGTPVVVACRVGPGEATVTVADRGRGMTAEDLASAFEPFYRAPEARRLGRPSAGLGLSVARRVVAASGGTIRAASRPGGGTRFILCFPTIPSPTNPGSPTSAKPGEGAGSMSTSSVPDSTMARQR
jgi:signal transduction histidine kinase